jgi:hypothetical protein
VVVVTVAIGDDEPQAVLRPPREVVAMVGADALGVEQHPQRGAGALPHPALDPAEGVVVGRDLKPLGHHLRPILSLFGQHPAQELDGPCPGGQRVIDEEVVAGRQRPSGSRSPLTGLPPSVPYLTVERFTHPIPFRWGP